MSNKVKHIDLNEREKELLNQAAKRLQEVDYNVQVANEMKAQQQSSINVMLELICQGHKIDYVQGTMYKDGKLIVPVSNSR